MKVLKFQQNQGEFGLEIGDTHFNCSTKIFFKEIAIKMDSLKTLYGRVLSGLAQGWERRWILDVKSVAHIPQL